MHPRDQLVEIMQRIYAYSMTTTSGGNLSLIDSEGNMWITPAGVDKGKLTSEDMICVAKDGKIIGRHKPSSEYPFHQKIYERNPRLKAILHAHPPALSAFSIIREVPNTRVLPQVFDICGEVKIAKYATPGTDELADYISASFKDSNCVLLENHGVVIGGDDLLSTFQRFETLDFCARILIRAKSLGKEIKEFSENKLTSAKLTEFVPKDHSNHELELRKDICSFAKRAYDQRLMISTEGTISTRVEGDVFLITPYGVDRKYLDAENIVLIKDKQREKGKTPSRAVLLHDTIYRENPNISAIITAQAPNIMAYGITGATLDTRTIPENYILLRKIPIVTEVKVTNPVVILQNDAVLATGSSLLKAFDRLEVAERAAETVLNSMAIGKMILLNEKQVKELDERFLS